MTWELRWHPFRAEWVLFTSHRGARPWIGEVVAHDEVSAPADNTLAPLGRRIDTTNPDYRGVFVFTNDLPVFSPDTPEPSVGDELYRTRHARPERPRWCVTTTIRNGRWLTSTTTRPLRWSRHGASAPGHCRLADDVAHVLIFENRGAAVGTSNPHPHCQIYAGALVYETMAREAEVAADHHRRSGRSLLAEVAERELAGPRVISDERALLRVRSVVRAVRV